MASDFAMFIREVIRKPGEIRAIVPSSSATAQLITQGLEDVAGPIVEIGPGTGSFTKAILARGVPPERLTLLEMNPRFCDELRDRFPGVTVLNRLAEDIDEIGLTDVGAVVSGVPLLARPKLQRGVVGRAFDVLTKDGVFSQLAYSRACPLSADTQAELGVTSMKRGTVWNNLPPARIFEYRRRPQ